METTFWVCPKLTAKVIWILLVLLWTSCCVCGMAARHRCHRASLGPSAPSELCVANHQQRLIKQPTTSSSRRGHSSEPVATAHRQQQQRHRQLMATSLRCRRGNHMLLLWLQPPTCSGDLRRISTKPLPLLYVSTVLQMLLPTLFSNLFKIKIVHVVRSASEKIRI